MARPLSTPGRLTILGPEKPPAPLPKYRYALEPEDRAIPGWPPLVRGPTAMLIGLLGRSEEHTSELQSPCNLVCRLLLENKKWEILLLQFPAAQCEDVPTPDLHQRECPDTNDDLRRLVPKCRSGGARLHHQFFFLMVGQPPTSTPFPHPPLSQ